MKQYYLKAIPRILLFALPVLFSVNVRAQVLAQDSLALVDFYNATNGDDWTNHNAWLSGNVSSWYGVTLKGNRVFKLSLPGNNVAGEISASITDLDSLVKLNVKDNDIQRLPALTTLPVLDTLQVDGNSLTFRDLQPNITAASDFIYNPQDSVDAAIDTLVLEQSTFVMHISIDTEAGVLNQYQWFKNGALISGANTRTYTLLCFDSAMAGSYTCRVTNSAVTGLTLYRYPVNVSFLRLANAGADIAVCDSAGSLLGNAPTAGNGTWALLSGAGVITQPTNNITTITQLGAGNNLFRWTMSNNALCPASHDYVVVTRDLPPSLPNASDDIEICTNHIQLNGNTPTIGTGLWTVTSGGGVVAQPTSPVSVVNGLSMGDNILRWQIFSGVCPPSVFDEIKIYVADTLQNSNAGSDYSLCPTETNLGANLPLHTVGTWTLISGNGNLADANNPGTYVSGMTEGPNVFRWTLTNACAEAVYDEVAVTVYNFTTVNVGPDTSFYFSPINPVLLGSGSPVGVGGNGSYAYQWSPVDNLSDGSAQHPQFSAPGIGTYEFDVTVTDGNGCTATDHLTLALTQFEVLAVPTLITPNNDGLNDFFYMPGIESYPYNELEIYDRTGQLVYKKKGYVNEFTGNSSEGMLRNNSVLPQDTYFYILTLEEGKIQKGFFELKK